MGRISEFIKKRSKKKKGSGSTTTTSTPSTTTTTLHKPMTNKEFMNAMRRGEKF